MVSIKISTKHMSLRPNNILNKEDGGHLVPSFIFIFYYFWLEILFSTFLLKLNLNKKTIYERHE